MSLYIYPKVKINDFINNIVITTKQPSLESPKNKVVCVRIPKRRCFSLVAITLFWIGKHMFFFFTFSNSWHQPNPKLKAIVRLTETILEGQVEGKKERGRQQYKWEANIRSWTNNSLSEWATKPRKNVGDPLQPTSILEMALDYDWLLNYHSHFFLLLFDLDSH